LPLAPDGEPALEFSAFVEFDTSNLPTAPSEQPAKAKTQSAGGLQLALSTGRVGVLGLIVCDNLPHGGPQVRVRIVVKQTAFS
jgi:hypothetical protein